jgi:hygromycin-B 4-O-kinase
MAERTMHLLKINAFLQDLRHPRKVWERRQFRSCIRTFLDRLPNWQGASHLRFIGRGSHSIAYFFVLGGEEYVIRVGGSTSAFSRDSFAARYADIFPVPRVFETGKFGEDRYYAISERAPGTQIRMLKIRSALKVIPMMFETFERIHLADVTATRDYGNVDGAGNGCSPSWQEFLLSYARYRESVQWNQEISGTFLDHQLFDRCLERMAPLVPFCPEERRLVHGDCSFCNVLSDGKQITGVVDWQHCSIGDALFDFASCYFWYYNSLHGKVWLEMIMQSQRGSEHFDERLRCYMLKSAAGALVNAALAKNIEPYKGRTVKVNHLLNILDKPIETWNR